MHAEVGSSSSGDVLIGPRVGPSRVCRALFPKLQGGQPTGAVVLALSNGWVTPRLLRPIRDVGRGAAEQGSVHFHVNCTGSFASLHAAKLCAEVRGPARQIQKPHKSTNARSRTAGSRVSAFIGNLAWRGNSCALLSVLRFSRKAYFRDRSSPRSVRGYRVSIAFRIAIGSATNTCINARSLRPCRDSGFGRAPSQKHSLSAIRLTHHTPHLSYYIAGRTLARSHGQTVAARFATLRTTNPRSGQALSKAVAAAEEVHVVFIITILITLLMRPCFCLLRSDSS